MNISPILRSQKMDSISGLILLLLIVVSSFNSIHGIGEDSSLPRYTFVVKEVPYTRLCTKTDIMTVNGEYPGPTLFVHKGETIIVDVINQSPHNITIHWHGVVQPRNPWTDGPEYITQCPIQPGKSFSQRVGFTTEEGTLWWHAHSDFTRATVHGAIVVYPKKGTDYPFPKPDAEVPIIFGEWWKKGVFTTYKEFLGSGGDPSTSDALTINGQPGDSFPCSNLDTFTLKVDLGKKYLLRLVNAVLQDMLFFAIASHRLTVVGTDGCYTKPFESDFISISPGQTIDVLLEAKPVGLDFASPWKQYYMAARVYSGNAGVPYDNTTATAILQYKNYHRDFLTTQLPHLPSVTDTDAAVNFTDRLRSLSTTGEERVPDKVTTKLFLALSMNMQPCPADSPCPGGPLNGTLRLAASINNVSFVKSRSMDILSAYYNHIDGVFETDFPDKPSGPTKDYTGEPPFEAIAATRGTRVKVLEYDSVVEVVFQGTNLALGVDHPIHLHGTSFYVVGRGYGNFDETRDPKAYNLVDPPFVNTVFVPRNGWTAIRFRANNPGVWLMHCHLERHQAWGMEMVFIVKNGKGEEAQMLPPPPGMPPC